MKGFYTYLWLREDGTPYYVGKGSGDRAYKVDNHQPKPPQDRSLILIQEFPSEEDAFVAERFLIAHYGRKDLGTGILRNRTRGGEGSSGARWTDASKAKLSKSLLGNTYNLGKKRPNPKPFSLETRKKMSESAKGNHSHLGHKHSLETAEFLRKLRKGTKLTLQQRQHISDRLWQKRVIQIL